MSKYDQLETSSLDAAGSRLPVTADVPAAIRTLLANYGAADPHHPMGQVLRDGLTAAPEARRRGGRAARVAPV